MVVSQGLHCSECSETDHSQLGVLYFGSFTSELGWLLLSVLCSDVFNVLKYSSELQTMTLIHVWWAVVGMLVMHPMQT